MKPEGPSRPLLRSRRSVLTAAAGVAAATAVGVLARPVDVAAADGDPLILGQDNQADTGTRLDGGLSLSPALEVVNEAPVVGGGDTNALYVVSLNGNAVIGESQGSFGLGSSGVHGAAVKAAGVGVAATNWEGGTALYVEGKTRFTSRSGRATVSAGASSVDIDLRSKGGLTGTPLCFANLMSDRPGVYVRAFRPNYPIAGKARIYLNRAVTANAYVAWFVLN